MYGWGRVYRTFCLFAGYVIILSGCGGGSTSGGAVSTTAATVDTTPVIQTTTKVPDTPSGVSAVGGTNKATLSWSAVNGATSYNIYWSAATGVTTATGARIASAGNIFIHRGLLPAVTYYYIVTAQNNSGESLASGQVYAFTATLDGTVPYTIYCAGCHGYLATSTAANAGVAEIKAALRNINNMSAITITDSQIAVISAALMYNQ